MRPSRVQFVQDQADQADQSSSTSSITSPFPPFPCHSYVALSYLATAKRRMASAYSSDLAINLCDCANQSATYVHVISASK
jgi:hypothetical protein